MPDEQESTFTNSLDRKRPAMYVRPNYASKRLLKDAIKAGDIVGVYSPGPFPGPSDGIIAIEGPHFPKAHKWYAQVMVEAGRVVKVIS